MITINLDEHEFNEYEKREIERLLKNQNPGLKDDLEQIWYLMDLIWDELGCDNRRLDWSRINRFYAHPIWILNGLFVEQHALSTQHRVEIAEWITRHAFKRIIDYGGGGGTLARFIADRDRSIDIDIFEPYPADFSIKRSSAYSNIRFVDDLSEGVYDCLISTDVLEHVPDPVLTLSEMVSSVKPQGYLIIANHFYPSIKCHLPQTFHLRYTFDLFARRLGLERVGRLKGSHATIYKRIEQVKPAWTRLRKLEWFSKSLFPVLDKVHRVVRRMKRFRPKK